MSENWATAEGFFNAKVPKEKMDVPGLGLIWIHGLTCGEKDDYENNVVEYNKGTKEVKLQNARAVLMQMCVRNQHGSRLFSIENMGKLKELPALVSEPIIDVAKRLSGMKTDEIEDLVKNSLILQGLTKPDSGSESPNPKAGQ